VRGSRRAAVALGLGLLLVPDAQVAPTAISLVAVGQTTEVDFGKGVVVVLALGSDSQSGDPLEGNADAIELIALNFETGDAAAVGIPRDTLVEVDGYQEAKINSGLLVGDPELMATEVEQLTGVKPQYVVTTGSAGFQALVDEIGPITVDSQFEFEDPAYGLTVTKGPNEMDGKAATGFARSRKLPGSDFDRMANHQGLLQAILVQLREHEADEGFVESSAIAAVMHLDTNLSPVDLYRFAQAISQVEPARTTTCVLVGPPADVEGLGNVIRLDEAYAARVAADAADNGHLDGGC
jgi:polyisoprenyl-teichoic acid--peptidoglycan teichoic acid transferase